MQPGRSCPLHYRYAPASLNRPPEVAADTLYVIGGLYGNLPALHAIEQMAARESGPVELVFNGDFNWFNIDSDGFSGVNKTVLAHRALRGNVETEIAGDDDTAGCGCGYPDSVSDAEVARSNRILARLRETAREFAELRARLATLPMHLTGTVGGLRIAIVHGDCESLAGWAYDESALASASGLARTRTHLAGSGARIIASSHTCLPVALMLDAPHGRCALFNNGAAGMPNFAGTHFGLITRIATTPAASAAALYGTIIDGVHIDALAVEYDHLRWQHDFVAHWPPGSAAHQSYFRRITEGPRYGINQAVRSGVSLCATTLQGILAMGATAA